METSKRLESRFSSTFSVRWQHITKSQLSGFLTKQQLGVADSTKLSYAAVTQGTTMASPVVVTSMQQSMLGYTNTTVPLVPPQQVPVPVSPYARMFPSHPLPGLGVPSTWHNYIVYSMGAQQPPAIMPCSDADQAVYPQRQYTHQHLQLQRPPPSQVYQSFQPPNRSHPSPKPGGYPTDRVMMPVARAPTGSRSPTTSALISTRPSPQ